MAVSAGEVSFLIRPRRPHFFDPSLSSSLVGPTLFAQDSRIVSTFILFPSVVVPLATTAFLLLSASSSAGF